MKKKNNLKAWLYLLPAILFLGVFMLYPLVDVCIDTGGAVVGVIILGSAICLCGKLVKILRKNRQKFVDHSAPQDNC